MDHEARYEAPVTDQVFVGVCHHLNSRLAAANAYLFLLRRRGVLGEFDAPLQEQMDGIADTVHTLRSLCLDAPPRPGPVSLGELLRAATELMRDHPSGPVTFEVASEPETGAIVLKVDWPRAIRALVTVGSWMSREQEGLMEIRVSADAGGTPSELTLVDTSGAAPGLPASDGDSGTGPAESTPPPSVDFSSENSPWALPSGWEAFVAMDADGTTLKLRIPD